MNYLKLIRWPNLLLIVITQFLIKYTLFEPFGVDITLNWFGLALLSLSTICLAAAGYIINDIYDVEADEINKPEKQLIGNTISEKMGYRLFFTFNIVGVLIGFYLSNIIGHPGFSILFIMISALLYAYASSLQKYVLIGPIIISILVGLSILIVGLYDLLPAITPQTRQTETTFFSILFDYFILAFLLNFIRELIKNQEDMDGDHKIGRKSLSLILGKERANKVIFAVALLPIFGVVYYLYDYLYLRQIAVVYALVFILAPLFYVLFKILSAKHKKDFTHLSLILKLVMLFGVLSIGLYQFILL